MPVRQKGGLPGPTPRNHPPHRIPRRPVRMFITVGLGPLKKPGAGGGAGEGGASARYLKLALGPPLGITQNRDRDCDARVGAAAAAGHELCVSIVYFQGHHYFQVPRPRTPRPRRRPCAGPPLRDGLREGKSRVARPRDNQCL